MILMRFPLPSFNSFVVKDFGKIEMLFNSNKIQAKRPKDPREVEVQLQ